MQTPAITVERFDSGNDTAPVAHRGEHTGAGDTVCVFFGIHLNSELFKFIKSCITLRFKCALGAILDFVDLFPL